MARKPLTTAEQVFTLKELLTGRTPAFVAAALGRTDLEVSAWAADHGHPDTGRMRQHLKRAQAAAETVAEVKGPLQGRVVDEPARRSIPTPPPAHRRAAPARPDLSVAHTAPPVTPPAAPVTPPAPAVTPAPAFADLDDLYFRATTAKARRLAQRARDAVAALHEQITTDEATAAQKARQARERAAELEQAAAERAAAKAEVDRLEAELAKARVAARVVPRKSPTGTTYKPTLPDGATTAMVRAWAKENGHEVAQRGLLPQALVDAYTTATAAAAPSEAGAA